MTAYKFLAAGGIGPFTGFRWPVGEWVEADGVDLCRDGIHACRASDLPNWIDDELWEIELDGEVVEQERKLVARRGRLVRRLEGWTPELLHDFGATNSDLDRSTMDDSETVYVAEVEAVIAQIDAALPDGVPHA